MPIKVQKILLPTDFSDSAKHALMYALSFAMEYDAGLIVLHVIPELNLPSGLKTSIIPLYDEMEKSARKKISRLVPKRFLEKIKVQNVIVKGEPFLEIVEVAKKHKVDLITIATHGRTGLDYATFGSTTERVIRKAPCPVLVVRHPG
ncbi:MAG: universal stress protein [Candidatus Brocadiales bacterium]